MGVACAKEVSDHPSPDSSVLESSHNTTSEHHQQPQQSCTTALANNGAADVTHHMSSSSRSSGHDSPPPPLPITAGSSSATVRVANGLRGQPPTTSGGSHHSRIINKFLLTATQAGGPNNNNTSSSSLSPTQHRLSPPPPSSGLSLLSSSSVASPPSKHRSPNVGFVVNPIASPSNNNKRKQSSYFQSVQLDDPIPHQSSPQQLPSDLSMKTISSDHRLMRGRQSPTASPAPPPQAKSAGNRELIPVHYRRPTLLANGSTPHLTTATSSWAETAALSSGRASRRSEERLVKFEKTAVLLTRVDDGEGGGEYYESFLRSAHQSVDMMLLDASDECRRDDESFMPSPVISSIRPSQLPTTTTAARQQQQMDQLHKRISELGLWCPPPRSEDCDDLAVPHSTAARTAAATVAQKISGTFVESFESPQLAPVNETSHSTLLGSFTLPAVVAGATGSIVVVAGTSSRAPSISRGDHLLKDSAMWGGEEDERECSREVATSSSIMSYRELDLQHVRHGEAQLIPA